MSFKKPGTWPVATSIARVTFFEVIRDKVLYNIIVCAALLFALGFLASRLTFIRPERVTLDFGMSAVNLSCAMIAIFAGAGLIGREFERRTIHVALSHPISRPQFVLGKYLGIAWVVSLNWVLLCGAYFLLLWASAGEFGAFSIATILGALLLLLAQSWVVAGLAVFFSTFSTTSLSVIMTIGLYLVGNNVSEIRAVAARVKNPVGSVALNGLAAVLPNLEYFNIGDRVTYGLPVEGRFLLAALAYGGVMVAFLLVAAGVLIRRREV